MRYILLYMYAYVHLIHIYRYVLHFCNFMYVYVMIRCLILMCKIHMKYVYSDMDRQGTGPNLQSWV